jgi:hypothetical protein
MGSPLKVLDISYYDLQSYKMYIEYMFGLEGRYARLKHALHEVDL